MQQYETSPENELIILNWGVKQILKNVIESVNDII